MTPFDVRQRLVRQGPEDLCRASAIVFGLRGGYAGRRLGAAAAPTEPPRAVAQHSIARHLHATAEKLSVAKLDCTERAARQ